MKSVLISIQPYWVFLIIAKKMGWNIGKEKTVEVRKNYPKDENWNKIVKIYCSKDKKSFAKIPKEYQPLMERFLGKVIGEFLCDCIGDYWFSEYDIDIEEYEDVQLSCLSAKEIIEYGDDKELYFWYICDLVIYDEPRDLSEFRTLCNGQYKDCRKCGYFHSADSESTGFFESCCFDGVIPLTRPPQSWCYVQEASNND